MIKKSKIILVSVLFSLMLVMVIGFQNCSNINLSEMKVDESITCIELTSYAELVENTTATHVSFSVRDVQSQTTILDDFSWQLLSGNTIVRSGTGATMNLALSGLSACTNYLAKARLDSCSSGNTIEMPYMFGSNCEEEPPVNCELNPEHPDCPQNPEPPQCALPHSEFEVIGSARYDDPFVGTIGTSYPNPKLVPIGTGFGKKFDESSGGQFLVELESVAAGTYCSNHPKVPLTYWSFTVQEGSQGTLGVGATMVPLFISECPGRLDKLANNNSSYCRKNSGNSSLSWSTTGAAGRCQLIPGKTYYLNLAPYDTSHYTSTGQIKRRSEQLCNDGPPWNHPFAVSLRFDMTLQ